MPQERSGSEHSQDSDAVDGGRDGFQNPYSCLVGCAPWTSASSHGGALLGMLYRLAGSCKNSPDDHRVPWLTTLPTWNSWGSIRSHHWRHLPVPCWRSFDRPGNGLEIDRVLPSEQIRDELS